MTEPHPCKKTSFQRKISRQLSSQFTHQAQLLIKSEIGKLQNQNQAKSREKLKQRLKQTILGTEIENKIVKKETRKIFQNSPLHDILRQIKIVFKHLIKAYEDIKSLVSFTIEGWSKNVTQIQREVFKMTKLKMEKVEEQLKQSFAQTNQSLNLKFSSSVKVEKKTNQTQQAQIFQSSPLFLYKNKKVQNKNGVSHSKTQPNLGSLFSSDYKMYNEQFTQISSQIQKLKDLFE